MTLENIKFFNKTTKIDINSHFNENHDFPTEFNSKNVTETLSGFPVENVFSCIRPDVFIKFTRYSSRIRPTYLINTRHITLKMKLINFFAVIGRFNISLWNSHGVARLGLHSTNNSVEALPFFCSYQGAQMLIFKMTWSFI